MKTYTFTVTIPNIPDDWDWTRVQLWLYNQITHPYDAAYEADVTVEWDGTYVPVNPERENNGCMAHKRETPLS